MGDWLHGPGCHEPQTEVEVKVQGIGRWEDVEKQCHYLDLASMRISSLTLNFNQLGEDPTYSFEAAPHQDPGPSSTSLRFHAPQDQDNSPGLPTAHHSAPSMAAGAAIQGSSAEALPRSTPSLPQSWSEDQGSRVVLRRPSQTPHLTVAPLAEGCSSQHQRFRIPGIQDQVQEKLPGSFRLQTHQGLLERPRSGGGAGFVVADWAGSRQHHRAASFRERTSACRGHTEFSPSSSNSEAHPSECLPSLESDSEELGSCLQGVVHQGLPLGVPSWKLRGARQEQGHWGNKAKASLLSLSPKELKVHGLSPNGLKSRWRLWGSAAPNEEMRTRTTLSSSIGGDGQLAQELLRVRDGRNRANGDGGGGWPSDALDEVSQQLLSELEVDLLDAPWAEVGQADCPAPQPHVSPLLAQQAGGSAPPQRRLVKNCSEGMVHLNDTPGQDFCNAKVSPTDRGAGSFCVPDSADVTSHTFTAVGMPADVSADEPVLVAVDEVAEAVSAECEDEEGEVGGLALKGSGMETDGAGEAEVSDRASAKDTRRGLSRSRRMTRSASMVDQLELLALTGDPVLVRFGRPGDRLLRRKDQALPESSD